MARFKLSRVERLFRGTSIDVSCTNPAPISLDLDYLREDFKISFNGRPCMMIDEKKRKVRAYDLKKVNRMENGIIERYIFALDRLAKAGYDIRFTGAFGPKTVI